MKAFIGCSFDDDDEQFINQIVKIIKSNDIECVDAKPVENETVDEKIRRLIKECEIFVGIFTCNEIICQTKKDKKWFCKPKIKATYTTSNWVIQESGFALGINKHLILLKEDGVCELPKLQGNLEYITFNKGSLDDTLLKLNQVINDIKRKATGGLTLTSSIEFVSPDETTQNTKLELPKKPEEEANLAMNKVYDALWREEDYSKAQRIFDDEAEALLGEEDRIPTRALILRESGNGSSFEKLLTLVKENSDNPRVIKQLAYRYKKMREYKIAKEQFLLAAGKYDVNEADKKLGAIDAYVEAAKCLAKDDNLNGALSTLRELLFEPNFQDSKAPIFKGMAEICKDNDDDRFHIYAEASLDIEPRDTGLRFSLAYVYSQKENEIISFLHYKKITDTIVHSAALNNLGVKYYELKLKGKSIESFYKSAECKETLAMGNIAEEFFKVGFFKDAQNLISKANKLSTTGIKVDPKVGATQDNLSKRIVEENKEEKEILSKAEKERKFYVKYSNAFCSNSTIIKENIEGIWKTTAWGDLKLKFNEKANSFSINKKIQEEDTTSILGNLFVSSQTPSQPIKYINQHIKITGTIENMSGKYNIEVEGKKSGDKATILTGSKAHEATGYMVINETIDRIEIMEKTTSGKTEYIQWTKQSNEEDSVQT